MMGSHWVMESPEPVSRVSPPMVTMARITSATDSSQKPTARRDLKKFSGTVIAALLIASPPEAVKTVKMSRRTKTLIAAIVIVFFWLPFYALFIMGLARHVLPGAPWYVALLFYALAGTLWIVPIGLSLPWMNREPSRR